MVFYKRTVDLAYDSINDTPNIEADAKEESLKKKAKLNPLTTNVALLHKNTVEIEKLERKLGELNRELYHLEFRTHNVSLRKMIMIANHNLSKKFIFAK